MPSQHTAAANPNPLLLALRDIKLAHTVFALPFALLAAFLAAPIDAEHGGIVFRIFLPQLALIVACMFFARTWAMLVNRLADAKFDKDNPRTAGRAVAAGQLSSRAGWTIALASAGAFWITTFGFLLFRNPWPALLAPIALFWTAAYAYTKRFTALCHIFLGTALAISPICAAIAINPQTLFSTDLATITIFQMEGSSWAQFTINDSLLLSLVALAIFITCWVAGFDIAYALADLDFDRKTGLHSIPASLGVNGALLVSRLLHAGAIIALLAFAHFAPSLGVITLSATAGVACLLIYEHLVLAERGIAGLPIAFFTINGIISVAFSTAAIVDTFIQ
ncbi:MAG: UbiA-like polyprenyltransferase [Planctomycetota bacterium]